MADFKKLRVWRHAHILTLRVNKVARSIKDPDYAPVRRQLLKTALSITANIVEGREKSSEREFARHLEIAKGSTSELEQHVIAARDLHLLTQSEFHKLARRIENVRRMLSGLLETLRSSISGKGGNYN